MDSGGGFAARVREATKSKGREAVGMLDEPFEGNGGVGAVKGNGTRNVIGAEFDQAIGVPWRNTTPHMQGVAHERCNGPDG